MRSWELNIVGFPNFFLHWNSQINLFWCKKLWFAYHLLARKQPWRWKLLKFSAQWWKPLASRISTRLCKLVSVYKILLPEPNYQLKKAEKSTTGFSSQKFYSDKQYIGFSCVCEHSHVIFADTTAVFMAMAWSDIARLCEQNYKNYTNLEQTIS